MNVQCSVKRVLQLRYLLVIEDSIKLITFNLGMGITSLVSNKAISTALYGKTGRVISSLACGIRGFY